MPEQEPIPTEEAQEPLSLRQKAAAGAIGVMITATAIGLTANAVDGFKELISKF